MGASRFYVYMGEAFEGNFPKNSFLLIIAPIYTEVEAHDPIRTSKGC